MIDLHKSAGAPEARAAVTETRPRDIGYLVAIESKAHMAQTLDFGRY
jgi:hypothetical protein